MLRCGVVDDNPSALRLLDLWCDKDDRVSLVYSSLSSFEMLDFILQTPDGVDILFSDIHMPGLDGISLIQQINHSLEHPPLFVLNTGHDKYSRQDVGFSILDFLDKPISYPEFQKTITHALETKFPNYEP